MKRIITALGLLFASSGFASDWTQICYTDQNFCFHYRTYAGDRFGEIIIADTDLPLVTEEAKADLKEIGFSLTVWPRNLYNSYAVKWPLMYRNLEADRADLQDPRVKTVVKSAAACSGGLAACAGSSYLALETAGGSLFMARLACGRAGFNCGMLIVDYNEWKDFQKQVKVNAEADAKSKSPRAGGGEPSTIGGTIIIPVGSPYHRRHGSVTIEDPSHPHNP